MSYPVHSLEVVVEFYSMQRCSWWIIQSQLMGLEIVLCHIQDTLGEGFYPSAEIQSMYFTAPPTIWLGPKFFFVSRRKCNIKIKMERNIPEWNAKQSKKSFPWFDCIHHSCWSRFVSRKWMTEVVPNMYSFIEAWDARPIYCATPFEAAITIITWPMKAEICFQWIFTPRLTKKC